MGLLSQPGHVGFRTQTEVVTVTITGTPTGGTFTLTYSGQTTAGIDFDATASEVLSALEALSNIEPGELAVSGGPGPGTPFVIRWLAGALNPADITASGASLTGGTAPAATAVVVSGKGTYADPGAADPNQGVFCRLRSGSLGGNRDLLIPDPEIGGGRDVPDAQLGPIAFSGEYDMYVRMESLAFFLKAVLGVVETTGPTDTSVYTHVITPSATTIPWVSIEEKISDGFEAFNYTDAKCNTFHMEADATGYLMGTAGFIALTQTRDTSPTSVATQRVDISQLIVGTSITVAWGGVQLPAKSFSLDINNNLEDDDFRLGSLFLGALTEKRREITMGVTIRPEDAALWKTAMWGGPAATTPGGQSFKDDVSVTITSYENIPGSTTKYSAAVAIPQAIIAPFNVEPSGDDVIEHDIEIRAVQPNPAVDIATFTVLNSYVRVP